MFTATGLRGRVIETNRCYTVCLLVTRSEQVLLQCPDLAQQADLLRVILGYRERRDHDRILISALSLPVVEF